MTERVLGPNGSKKRSRRLLTLVALMGAALMVFFVGTSSAILNGSTFNTSNGDLTTVSATVHDWNPPGQPAGQLGPVETITCPPSAPGAGTNCGLDHVNNAADNSFTQGTKEDDTAAVIGDGSIPPNKDDLSRFYVNKERRSVTGCGGAGKNVCDYLYLAWERSNTLGSAHMDFEFNQADVGVTSSTIGDVALNRTVGDLLVDFDFGGSGTPSLIIHRWIVTNTPGNSDANGCEAVNSGTNVACWNNGVLLTATAFAEASVNTANITDHNPPGAPRTLPGSSKTQGGKTTIEATFGEAAINLTGANVFPPNQCFHLGGAWLKSRSSGESFDSAMKDFIAPIPINITNCGAIRIIKQTSPRGVDTGFPFTSTIPDPVGQVTPTSSPYCQQDNSPSAFTLNDKNANVTPPTAPHDSLENTEDCVNVLAAVYTVSETIPSGWTLSGRSCSVTGTGGSTGGPTSGVANQVTIDLKVGDLVECVFTNQQQLGAIVITKTGKYKNCSTQAANSAITVSGSQIGVCGPAASLTTAKLGNAQFKVTTDSGGTTEVSGSPVTTSTSTGTVCIDGLAWSGTGTDYWVTETVAPTGYSIDLATAVKVTVIQSATCNAAKTGVATGTGATHSASDTPLTNITVTVSSVRAGATNSSISCTGPSPGTGHIGNSPQPASGMADPVTMHADSTNSTNPVAPGVYTCTIDVDP